MGTSSTLRIPGHAAFPSEETLRKINCYEVSARFSIDLSALMGMSDDDVMRFVEGERREGRAVRLNFSHASREEMRRIMSINQKLSAMGFNEIELAHDRDRIEAATRAITEEALAHEKVRLAVIRFIREALENSGVTIAEWNVFSAPREKNFEDQHYWDNIGVKKDNELRTNVTECIDEAVAEISDGIWANILPNLAVNPAMQSGEVKDEEQIRRTFGLAMVSNFVRAVFYRNKGIKITTELRLRALKILDEALAESAV